MVAKKDNPDVDNNNNNKSAVEKEKRVKLSQTDFPRFSLEKALDIAKALWDNFGGKSAEPYQVAIALNLSPSSGHWRNLTGSSIAYGLTEGGYNAKEITLTTLGKGIVAPTYDGEDTYSLSKAALQPSIMRTFFEKYDKSKLPSPTIGNNILTGLGVPKDRASEGFGLITQNGYFAGFIMETKTGPFVSLTLATNTPQEKISPLPIPSSNEDADELISDAPDIETFARQISSTPEVSNTQDKVQKNSRVFISHGKNKQVVEQLKEIIKFGKYEPVVSVENESLSKPVPDKVMDDMRSCFAGIINVHSEGEMLDSKGNSHNKINDNVLIEIGAAIALYGRNYILLVQKGVELPSNLQGLYRCEYEGEKLDYDATMKLLKAFNQFS